MATTVSLAGVSYSIPNEGDGNYAQDLTAYLIALANNTKVFQASSANFPLQQETNFGANYGLKVAYIKSQAANPSGTGIYRLGNNESVSWRNSSNTTDLSLKVNSSDVLEFNGTSISIGGTPVQTAVTVSDTSTVDLTLSSNDISATVKASSLDNSHIATLAAIAYSKLNLTSSIVNADINAGAAIAHNKMAALSSSKALVSDSSGVVSTSSVTSTELGYLSGVTSSVQTQLNINSTGLTDHLADAVDAHDASAISSIPTGNLFATDVQSALNELQSDIDTRAPISSTVTLTGTQTLTNKTLTAPVLTNPSTEVITLDGQASAPSSPSVGYYKAYVKDTTKKLTILNSDGVETTVGSGGGSKNFISNGDVEAGTTGFATYKDTAASRPVDGSGGTASRISIAASSTNPLVGNQSLLITNSGGGSAQGEGVSYDFTIDSAYKAKVLQIEMEYVVNSGTFVAGSNSSVSDLIVYIYDVTNSQVIEPSSFKLLSNSSSISDKFIASFQTSSNSTNYRLIFHVASSNTSAWSLKLDDITVSPSRYIFGTPITDWVTYTPSLSITLQGSGIVAPTGRWRRVGDTVEVTGSFTNGNAAATGGTLTWSLPFAVDSNKQVNSVAGFRNDGTAFYNQTAVTMLLSGSVAQFINPGTVDFYLGTAIASGARITFKGSYPVVGWSSSVQMSDSADTRVVAYSGRDSALALTSSPQVLKYITSVTDTHGGLNTSTGEYTIPTSGYYNIYGCVLGTAGVGTYLNIAVNRGSGFITEVLGYSPNQKSTVEKVLLLKSGDRVQFQCYLSTGTGNVDVGFGDASITKVSGPSAIAATEEISCKYGGSTTTVGTTGTILIHPTKIYDTHGAYNPSTGVFTCPAAGRYRVTAFIESSGTPSATAVSNTTIDLRKNSVTTSRLAVFLFQVTGVAMLLDFNGSTTVDCLAGDTLDLSAVRSSNFGSYSLSGSSTTNYLCIERIK